MNQPVHPTGRSQWSSQFMFCVAAIGSAVGLGNIWRFPYVLGENGGGIFVLVYIFCVILLLPVMTGEILLGRRGRKSPVGSMRRISQDFGFSSKWVVLGWTCMLGATLVLSFYSVIAGTILAYFSRAAGFMFTHITPDGAESIRHLLFSDPEKLLLWHTIFSVTVGFAIATGIREGIERSLKYLMPILFLFLIFLFFYALFRGAFAESITFLTSFNIHDLTPQVFLMALGQAFFSLSIAYGSIMIYGAYLPPNANIVGNSIVISVVDTLVAIVAAIFIFSIVFKYGLEPAQGFGLIFNTIPLALSEMMEMGYVVGLLFFGLLAIASWTSAISLLEPVVAWVLESFKCSRLLATVVAGLTIWLLGIGTIFSFTHPESWSIDGATFFNIIDYTTTNFLLPVSGILIAVFAGWKLPAIVLREELHILTPKLHALWRIALRYVCPLCIVAVLLGKILHLA